MAIYNLSLSTSDFIEQSNMQIQSNQDRIESFLAKKFRCSRSFATKRSYKVNLKRFVEFLDVKYALIISDTEKIDQNYSEMQKDNQELCGIVDSL